MFRDSWPMATPMAESWSTSTALVDMRDERMNGYMDEGMEQEEGETRAITLVTATQ